MLYFCALFANLCLVPMERTKRLLVLRRKWIHTAEYSGILQLRTKSPALLT